MASQLFKLSLALALVMAVQSYVRVCYYTNWSQYRNGVGKYSMTNHYERGLCTHLIFSFGKVVSSSNGYTISTYEWNDKDLYKQMQSLKKSDPGLKTLLAIGGWTHGSNGFMQMVANKVNRQKFVANSLAYIKAHGFDGLDLDWEFPAARGSPAGDRQRFSDLCEELADAYRPHGLLVTAAVKASYDATQINYEVNRISKSLDFINLMTYDLYGSWDPKTGHHTSVDMALRPHNVERTVKAWLDNGASPDKLVLGLASYGRSFQLKNECVNHIGAAASKGRAGKFTGEGGFLAYYEICNMKFDNHVCAKDSSAHAPYGNAGKQWVGYDDKESIVYKINNVMKKYNMKGYMFWALDLDDFTGTICGQGKYPLMNAAKKAASGQSVSFQCKSMNKCGTTPPPPPGPTDPTKTTKPPVVVTGKCKPKGHYVNIAGMDRWCNLGDHCQQVCSASCQGAACDACQCGSGPEPPKTTTTTTMKTTTTTTPTTTTTTTSTTTTKKPGPIKYTCQPTRNIFGLMYYCNHFCQESCQPDRRSTYRTFFKYCACRQ